MRSRFDKELAQLNSELINMGTLIEEAIQNAVGALVNQNVEQAHRAVDFDVDVDQKEKDIENICYKLLLHQQPVAGDLRLITAALKMVSDMERIGDQAADISELTIAMSQKPYIKNLEHIRSMAKETMIMLVKSIGKTRFLDERVENFAKKFTEDLLVLDQKDLDLSNVAEEARQYIAAILTGVVIRHFVEAIAFERGHSLDVRRYMWQMEY